MQTEIKEIEIRGYYHRSNQNYLDTKLKEIETLGVDEQYSLNINDFGDEKEIKKIFESVFMKQKPNLIEMELSNMKLFSNFFSLFTEKRWEKLNHIKFCKCSFIQFKLTLMINVLKFSPNAKCRLWKNLLFWIAI